MKYSSKSKIQREGMKYGEQIENTESRGIKYSERGKQTESRGMIYSEQIKNIEQGYEIQ